MRDQIVALLEDGPKAAVMLAGWLQVERAAAEAELRAMAKDRLVRRTGQLWQLRATTQASPGRKKKTPAPIGELSWWARPYPTREAWAAEAARQHRAVLEHAPRPAFAGIAYQPSAESGPRDIDEINADDDFTEDAIG